MLTHSLSQFSVNFGTSGARGRVEDFTEEYCWTFVNAFLQLFETKPRTLLVGHDLRPSSPLIARRCIEAANAAGARCLFAGALPTPALALGSLSTGLPSIMVTGSHIPADRNGLKAYRPEGEVTKADERSMSLARVPATHQSPSEFDLEQAPKFRGAYLRRYLDFLPKDALSDLRIGVYEHSSVSRDLLHEVLRQLGAETCSFARSETFVPVDTEAIREEDVNLAREWAANNLDAIVSTDGDGDRPLIADETGAWIRGDVLGILCARVLGARTVVTPVSSNTGAEASGAFASVIRTRIGSPYVIEGMQSAAPGPVVGYEANGGVLLGSDVVLEGRRISALPTRDALLPILVVTWEARRRGVRLSELVSHLPQRFTFSARLQNIQPERGRRLIDALAGDLAFARDILAPTSGEVITIDQSDGFRVQFGSGDIVHLRLSGNAPELRCYTEADSTRLAKELCEVCLGRVSATLSEQPTQIDRSEIS